MFRQQTSLSQSAWRILSVLLFLFTFSLTHSMNIFRTFTDPGNNPLQRLAVHNTTGDVYVGGTNRLHRLTSQLTLSQSVATGPESNNLDCASSQCRVSKHLQDGVTKSLVIDYSDNTLLVCATLRYSPCRKVALDNVSSVVQIFHKPLVPVQENASCVMFIGPSLKGQIGVYIGAEYSNSGNKSYNDLIPSISSRDLVDLNLIFKDEDGGTQKFIREDLRTSFLVQFIHGFVHGDFAYFMTVQKENFTSNNFVTKISRVCTRDKYFRSYVEIPLWCENTLKPYHVLQAAQISKATQRVYAVFGDSTAEWWKMGESSSVLCAVDIAELDREFDHTVQQCYWGSGRVGPLHYEDVRTCVEMRGEVDGCGVPKQSSEVYPSLEGQRAVVSRALWTLTDQRATAVTVQDSDGHSSSVRLAFVGTADGDVVKVAIQEQWGHEVARLSVGGRSPVVQIQAAPSSYHLYVLSASEVSMVSTVQCEQTDSCHRCRANPDPRCGWCSGQNRCTTATDCESKWLAGTSGYRCPQRSAFQSPVLSYETVQSALADHQISFRLEERWGNRDPSSDLDLFCLFVTGSTERRTPASMIHEVISCPLPPISSRPHPHPLGTSDDGENTVLRFHVHGKTLVTRSAAASACGSLDDCGSCTNRTHPCQWCFAMGTCVPQSHPCPQQSGSSGGSQSPALGIKSPGACPLVWMSSRDKEILVHAGGTRRVAVQVRNLQGEQSQDIRCHFSYLGSRTTVHGALSSQSLTCDPVKFDYPDKEQLPYVTADFQVSWGPQSLPLDNTQGIQVRIYKCSLLVTNCGKCLSMDPEYECGWCADRCSLQKHCPKEDWLDRTATCPHPQILRFSPTTGPIKGRSTLSVTGLNLGKAYTDIKRGVQVAGTDCEVKPQHYEPSSGFICEIAMTEKEKTGTVVVVVDNRYTAISDSNFTFVDPRVLDLAPKSGPRSGGTTVVIKGTHMDTGSDVSVSVGGGNCEVIKRNHTMMECVTSKQSGPEDKAEVKVNFGGHEQPSPEPFMYANDPIITIIEPKVSILSGGTSITVIGMRLDLIQKPEFFVTYGGHFFTEPCQIDNTLTMECPVPSLKSSVSSAGTQVTDSSPLELHYGFTLDGVTSLKNVSHEPNFGPLLVYPDPALHVFPGPDHTKLVSEDQLLVVSGDLHTVNQLMGSVSVQVGREECEGVSATETTLSCLPPSSAPSGTDPSGKAPVTVRVGNLVKRVGHLRYFYNDLSNGEDKPLTLGIVLGVVIPIIAIGILLTVCVLKRHRKHRPGTNYIPDVLQDYQDQPQAEEEMMGLTQITVVDVNGQALSEEDCGPYVTELLGHLSDTGERHKLLTTLIPYNTLHLGHLIGHGHFGSVYKAQLQGADGKSTPVAVKALQAKNRDKESTVKFLQEMSELKALQHPRLVPVLGVGVTATSDPLVVCPLLTSPDLRSYLRDPSKELTVGQLLGYGHQIADAMTFLHDVNVVHKNLAARNCRVSEETGEVQLTDYGLPEVLFPASHYVADDSGLVRWLAPECLDKTSGFTTKSDVWAFGVVLWELLTRGVTPYPELDGSSLLPYLKKGDHLPKLRQSPEPVSQLIDSCCNAIPDQRPDFRHLRQQLAQHTTDNNSSVTPDPVATALLHQPVKVTASTEYLPALE